MEKSVITIAFMMELNPLAILRIIAREFGPFNAKLGVKNLRDKLRSVAIIAFSFAFLSAAALHIPILGGIWGLFSLGPLMELFPELEKSGNHVEYGFLWLVIKSAYGWFVITTYYLLIWLLLFGTLTLLKNVLFKKSNGQNT